MFNVEPQSLILSLGLRNRIDLMDEPPIWMGNID